MKFALILVLLLTNNHAQAWETDQFNLPPVPLTDIGPELSTWVLNRIEESIAELNEKIYSAANVEEFQKEEALVQTVYEHIGASFPTSQIEKFAEHGFASDSRSNYVARYRDSIFIKTPLVYLTIGKTCNVFGTSLGSDKLGHFFQQGYRYHKIAHAKGLPEAIAWGQKMERTIYGYWLSGIYSNGDLAANYSGYKFYLNLTQEMKLGKVRFPAIVELINGHWALSSRLNGSEFFKPFMTDHLNEALNPSIYKRTRNRNSIKADLKERLCAQWINIKKISKIPFMLARIKLKTWYGEDYGFTEDQDSITLDQECFI